MSITDELREFIPQVDFATNRDMLARIADRINTDYEVNMLSERNIAYNDGFDAGFASADDWYVDHADELDAHGWVRLPVDADGVTIRKGDLMETERFGVVEVEGFIHNAIAFTVCDPQPARICTSPAHQCRHYHAPTVEDVLTEFAERYLDYEGVPSAGRRGIGEALMDEYAAKLQLKGEDE